MADVLLSFDFQVACGTGEINKVHNTNTPEYMFYKTLIMGYMNTFSMKLTGCEYTNKFSHWKMSKQVKQKKRFKAVGQSSLRIEIRIYFYPKSLH